MERTGEASFPFVMQVPVRWQSYETGGILDNIAYPIMRQGQRQVPTKGAQISHLSTLLLLYAPNPFQLGGTISLWSPNEWRMHL